MNEGKRKENYLVEVQDFKLAVHVGLEKEEKIALLIIFQQI